MCCKSWVGGEGGYCIEYIKDSLNDLNERFGQWLLIFRYM